MHNKSDNLISDIIEPFEMLCRRVKSYSIHNLKEERRKLCHISEKERNRKRFFCVLASAVKMSNDKPTSCAEGNSGFFLQRSSQKPR